LLFQFALPKIDVVNRYGFDCLRGKRQRLNFLPN
jgi:hypothetical protein